jgi:hypothetical protein
LWFKKKGEVGRKPFEGAFHRFVKALGWYAVNPRQIGVQNDALAANEVD